MKHHKKEMVAGMLEFCLNKSQTQSNFLDQLKYFEYLAATRQAKEILRLVKFIERMIELEWGVSADEAAEEILQVVHGDSKLQVCFDRRVQGIS